MAAATQGSTGGGSPDLLDWIRGLIGAGHAVGWQYYGQSSAWNAKEEGQDLGLPLGTPVPGTVGVVTRVERWPRGVNDWIVDIQRPSGDVVSVGHIAPLVKVGERITSGEIIGTSEGQKSPISSEPHIEFQVHPGGAGTTNPIDWLEKLAGKAVSGAEAYSTDTATAEGTPSPLPSGTGTAPSTEEGVGTWLKNRLFDIAIFLVALVLIIIGFLVMFHKQAGQVAQVATKVVK